MMNWLNREEREKQQRKRRWRFLGLALVGVAVAVYWFDRRTSNSFEHAPNLNLDQTPSSRAPESAHANRAAATSGPTATTDIAGGSENVQAATGGAATSTSASPGLSDDLPEPNTAEEDERIVQGETGQLAASRRIGTATDTEIDGASDNERGATESAEDLAATGPVPTITNGLIEGNGTHDCPDGYPIKGNASSRIYHLPGESSYDVTVPEVCFATEDDAAAAGYRPRKH